MQKILMGLGSKRPNSRGLRFRIIALLAFALLPIGVLGILQTQNLSREVQNRSELSLLALTNRATFGERQIFERAIGAAEAFSSTFKLMRDDPLNCRNYLDEYLEHTQRYTFVGFIPLNGIVTCSSAEHTINLSQDAEFQEAMRDVRARVAVLKDGRNGTDRLLNLMQPVTENREHIGYISISTPLARALRQKDFSASARPISAVTFDNDGIVLFSDTISEQRVASRPMDIELASLPEMAGDTFQATDQLGELKTFAVVPIVPNLVYTLAAWPAETNRSLWAGLSIRPTVFPILMFITSLAVAYLAIDRLIINKISTLQRLMRQFSQTRQVERINSKNLSLELLELSDGFYNMAMNLVNDEAKMENALREKNVLLKEVHHRVKNNLQLISSIMNMHIRTAIQPETHGVLKRLQERVLGLATVHRNLYQSENLSKANAGRLLEDLFSQMIVAGVNPGTHIEYSANFDDVILFPDQMVPLSLLASELGTNAIKYSGKPSDASAWISVSLKHTAPQTVQLICENSLGKKLDAVSESTGLGSKLIQAFVMQINGKMDITETSDRYCVSVTFDIQDFSDSPDDNW